MVLDGPGHVRPIEPATLDVVFGRVAAYYAAKLARHGATPRGVDWSCAATQWLRFVQLLKICDFDTPFSLIDVGCGYGALAAFIRARHPGARVDYLGIDLSAAMVRCAKRRHRGRPATRFQAGRNCPHQADYAVASGIMNVTLGCPRPLWEDGVCATLVDLRRVRAVGLRGELPDRGAGRVRRRRCSTAPTPRAGWVSAALSSAATSRCLTATVCASSRCWRGIDDGGSSARGCAVRHLSGRARGRRTPASGLLRVARAGASDLGRTARGPAVLAGHAAR